MYRCIWKGMIHFVDNISLMVIFRRNNESDVRNGCTLFSNLLIQCDLFSQRVDSDQMWLQLFCFLATAHIFMIYDNSSFWKPLNLSFAKLRLPSFPRLTSSDTAALLLLVGITLIQVMQNGPSTDAVRSASASSALCTPIIKLCWYTNFPAQFPHFNVSLLLLS